MLFDRIRSLVRHTAVYGVGDFLRVIISAALLPVYARLLSPEENGVRDLAFAFIAFSTVVYSLGINQALIRHLSAEEDPLVLRRRFSSAFWTISGIALLLAALVWCAASPLASLLFDSGLATQRTDLFGLIAAIILLDAVGEPLFTLCRARKRSSLYAGVRLVQHTVQIGLTIYLIAGLGYGVRGVFWSNVASSAFAVAALLPFGLKSLRIDYAPKAVREFLSFGLPFVPSALALLVIELSDRLMVRVFLGLDATGVYGISYKFALPMLLVVRALRAAWAPAVLSVPDTGEARQVCARVTTYYAAIGGFLVLGLAAFPRELILLVAWDNAPAYLPGQNVIALVALAYLCNGFYVILTAGVYVEGRSRVLPAIVGAGAVLNVAMNLLLIPRIGFIAAAWSTLAAYGLMALLLFLSVRRFYPVRYEYGRLGKICVAASIAYLMIWKYTDDTTLSGIAARAVIFLVVYPTILWGWRLFDPAEWQDLRSVLNFSRTQDQDASTDEAQT